MTMIMLSSIFCSIMFLQSLPPLFLTALIIFQALVVSLTLAFSSIFSWFSYMLIMIIVSAMLLIFAYISSITSNQIILKPIFNNPFMVLLFLSFFSITNLPQTSGTTNLLALSMPINISSELYKLFVTSSMSISLFLINYLLYTLVIAIKISTISKGPLRKM